MLSAYFISYRLEGVLLNVLLGEALQVCKHMDSLWLAFLHTVSSEEI